jgi:hypothetical protein
MGYNPFNCWHLLLAFYLHPITGKMSIMKLTQYKSLFLTGVVLMALSLTIYAQSSSAPGAKGGQTAKKRSYTTPQSTQSASQSESSIYESGSSAQVRHDRTGSLNPGHAKSKDNKSATPASNNNQGLPTEP